MRGRPRSVVKARVVRDIEPPLSPFFCYRALRYFEHRLWVSRYDLLLVIELPPVSFMLYSSQLLRTGPPRPESRPNAFFVLPHLRPTDFACDFTTPNGVDTYLNYGSACIIWIDNEVERPRILGYVKQG
jgi:hypothetical protein